MEPTSKAGSASRRTSDFIVSPYLPDSHGDLQPEIPVRCLHSADGSPCHLARHSRRLRKVGPGYPLVVVRCQDHRCCFTLYPPGYMPYAREPLLPVSPDGTVCLVEEPETDPYAGSQLELSRAVEARLVGAANTISSTAAKATRRQGVRRHVEFAAELFGLLTGAQQLMERLSVVLVVSLPVLEKARETLSRTRALSVRLIAVQEVRAALKVGDELLGRLLFAGQKVGLWGQAWMLRATDRSLFLYGSPERT